MISEPQVHMYMSEKEFDRLVAGETAYGYSDGFTEYNIHVSVPVRFVKAVTDVSESDNLYYEYYVKHEEIV
ncbi:hypothetical protein BSP38_193 [Bacillus phage BSP38]|uniref:Uncharacterized protein n=1 Tax=Bacillus phage BSP38 TaxID=2283013 RepID=A0A345MK53_BPBSP|nr:hypothetical protein HWB82_gp125 [Bacillus phage BSP38]AXH71235.1 hypothetical protein BSP38_193 [Bacillus phage BSP38]